MIRLSLYVLAALCFSVFFSSSIIAQVTIGSKAVPLSGSLLDLKNKIPTATDTPC